MSKIDWYSLTLTINSKKIFKGVFLIVLSFHRNFSHGILRVWVFFCSWGMKVKANVTFCFAKVNEPCWIEYTPFKYFWPVLGKGSKIRLIIFVEFSAKGGGGTSFVENSAKIINLIFEHFPYLINVLCSTILAPCAPYPHHIEFTKKGCLGLWLHCLLEDHVSVPWSGETWTPSKQTW